MARRRFVETCTECCRWLRKRKVHSGGWGRRIRTPANGSRARRPTTRRSPSANPSSLYYAVKFHTVNCMEDFVRCTSRVRRETGNARLSLARPGYGDGGGLIFIAPPTTRRDAAPGLHPERCQPQHRHQRARAEPPRRDEGRQRRRRQPVVQRGSTVCPG